jgi:ribosomal protein S18 acetylase RimI-like enzyme
MDIRPARDVEEIRDLIEEYAGFLHADGDLAAWLGRELAEFPGEYAPPRGTFLLARIDGRVAGCVALRAIDERTAEVKRLYVRAEARGAGVGRALASELLAEAERLGYERVVLDTLPTMAAAQALYASLGFAPIDPYLERHEPGARCFALDLRERA